VSSLLSCSCPMHRERPVQVTLGAPAGRRPAATRRLCGASVGPLAVLFGLNLVDEFDRVAFAALAPEIRDHFGLGDTEIAAIGTVAALTVLLAALPTGFIADRTDRVRVCLVAATTWCLMTVLTGLAPAVAVLLGARLLSGLGRVASEIVHPSLLSELYPTEAHPRVFQWHRAANSVGALGGVLAGALAIAIGWRGAFLILALPTALLLFPLARLAEPKPRRRLNRTARGAAGTADHRRSNLRVVWSIRSMRRVCLVALLLGATFVTAPQFLSLFFEDVHGTGPLGRGMVQALFGCGVVAGLFVGGPLATRAMTTAKYRRLAEICTGGFVMLGGALIVIGHVPGELPAMLLVPVIAFGLGLFQPPYFTLVGRVAPPEVRSQAFALAVVFAGAGGVLGIGTFAIGTALGYTWAAAALGGTAIGAAAAAGSLHSILDRDLT
jgi:MFS family permease